MHTVGRDVHAVAGEGVESPTHAFRDLRLTVKELLTAAIGAEGVALPDGVFDEETGQAFEVVAPVDAAAVLRLEPLDRFDVLQPLDSLLEIAPNFRRHTGTSSTFRSIPAQPFRAVEFAPAAPWRW